MTSSIPSPPLTRCWRVPRVVCPFFRIFYFVHFAIGDGLRWFYRKCYASLLFKGRCTSIGSGFDMMKIPDIHGHSSLNLGNNVVMSGGFFTASGRVFDDPQINIADNVEFGPSISIIANKEVTFGKGCRIGADCRFMDSDAHPRDPDMRAANVPPPAEEVKPIRLGNFAAVGQGSFVLKGVTIGEGATIAVNSVVLSNIPAYATASGNPARFQSRKPKSDSPVPAAE